MVDDRETSHLAKLGAGVYYSIASQVPGSAYVNLVMSGNKSMSVSVDSVQWLSGNMKIQSDRGLVEGILGRSSNLVLVTNDSSDLGYVGLSKPQSGDVYIINFTACSSPRPFWVFKSPFLCAESTLTVKSKSLPLSHFSSATLGAYGVIHDVYHISGTHGSVFVQGGSSIVCKVLAQDESLFVSGSALVAVESSCWMESGGYSPQYLPYTCSDPPFLVKIKGPGTVHFSANSTSRTYTDQKQKNFRLSVVFLLSVAILYLTLALLTKSSEVIDRLVDEELLAAFHANQP